MGMAFICTTPIQLQDEPHLSQPLIFTYNTCCISLSMNNTNSKPMDISGQHKNWKNYGLQSVHMVHSPTERTVSKYCQSFIYSPTDAPVSCLKKTVIKFTLKQLQHVSMQSRHHQGAHYSCLLKLQLLK
jgi:hypothetical protein